MTGERATPGQWFRSVPSGELLGNLGVALLAGIALFASFPPRPLWFLAPVGVALLTWVLRSGRSVRGGAGYGLVAGLAFFVPLLPWTGVYVGALPWLALSLACALYVAGFGALARLIGDLPGWPLWLATCWSLAEWARASFPFGGFPWGRLAFSQPGGLLLPLAELGGAPLLSFAVALTGTALAATIERFRAGARRSGVRLAALALLAPVVGAALWPTLPSRDPGDKAITVAAIQGSVPRLGLDFNAQRRAVLDNHVRRTRQLADDVRAGRAPQPDLVIWPENASDIDPLRNTDAYTEISATAAQIDAPILVGAVLVASDDTATNSVIVWNPETGPGERHDKKIIQPFGEYLPMRSFFRLFSPYADRAGHFVPGSGDGTVHAAGVDIGIATCYEVAFDRAFEQSLRAGAQLLAVPTNNATFGDTEMTYQQLAMSRVRAVEHSRAVVVAATSGVSAIVGADGAVLEQTPLFSPAALVSRLPLRSGTTLATQLGPLPEFVLGGTALLTAAASIVLRRSRSGPRDSNANISAGTGRQGGMRR
ncbi:apolipoprotein N-acyltransferase [Skermania piniformis]|uniref:Apolipoprotein N-acyltransferase n=1 Tax=Skermania pinensis TaxID=39122 RepID=A0ABX8SC93_9ACTN|nr:apolipoprotein N-acyltransferase [Skermania piniformis]QXQ15494.1 apolipoprotein N-acyltransferase [Skermania piniformis]